MAERQSVRRGNLGFNRDCGNHVQPPEIESFGMLETLEQRMLLSATIYEDTDEAIKALRESGKNAEVVIDLGAIDSGDLSESGQINGELGRVSYEFHVDRDGKFIIGVDPDVGRVNFALFDESGRRIDNGYANKFGSDLISNFLDPGDYKLHVIRRADALTDYELSITTDQPKPHKDPDDSGQNDKPDKNPQGDSGDDPVEPDGGTNDSSGNGGLDLDGGIPNGAIFDLIRFKNEPDFAKDQGFLPITKIGTAQLWNPGDDLDVPNIQQIKRVAKTLSANRPIVIEIEHWHTDGSLAEVEESIDKLVQVARAFKEANPDLKIGFYRLLPARNWFTPVRYDDGHPEYERWQKRNIALKRLAEEVDYIFPSLYTFKPDYKADGTPDPDVYVDYRKYMLANIQEAKRYFGKPIIAFVSPFYPPDSHYFSNGLVSGEYWKRILRAVGTKADGMVIWTPYSGINTQWDPNSEWWQETLKFLDWR